MKNAIRAEDEQGASGEEGAALRQTMAPPSRFARSCRETWARLDESLPLLASNRRIAQSRGLAGLDEYYRLQQLAALWQRDLTVLACELEAAAPGWKKTLLARLACRMARDFMEETARLYACDFPRLQGLLSPAAAARHALARAETAFAALSAKEAGFLFGVMAGERDADAGQRLETIAALDTTRVLAVLAALIRQAAELEKGAGALWKEALGGPSAAAIKNERRKVNAP